MSLETQEGEQGSSFAIPEKYHELTTSRPITAEDVATMDRLRANGDPVLNQALQELAERFCAYNNRFNFVIIPNSDIAISQSLDPYAVGFLINPGLVTARNRLAAQKETVTDWLKPIETPTPTILTVLRRALGSVAVRVSPRARLEQEQDARLTVSYASMANQLMPVDSENMPDTKNTVWLPLGPENSFSFADNYQAHCLNRPFNIRQEIQYPPMTRESIWEVVPGASLSLGETYPFITLHELLAYDLLLDESPVQAWDKRVHDDASFFSFALQQLEKVDENYTEETKGVVDAQEWAHSELLTNTLRASINDRAQQIVDRLCAKIIGIDVAAELHELYESAPNTVSAGYVHRIVSAVDSCIQTLLSHGYKGAVAVEQFTGSLHRPIALLTELKYPRDNDGVERKIYRLISNEYTKARDGLGLDTLTAPNLPTFDAIFHPLSYEHSEILRNPDDLR